MLTDEASQNAMNDPKPLKILVVEDDSMVREVITVFLNGDNHHVEAAENGQEGLEKFAAGEFDVLLTDRSMPGMSGDQLAREAKRIRPQTPVILLTGYGDLMQGTDDHPAGVDLILGKPFTIDGLRGVIQQAVGA
jgi:CheY-like chemotaxis protein